MKFSQVLLVIILFLSVTFISNTEIKVKAETKTAIKEAKSEVANNDIFIGNWQLKNVPVFWQGWVRYYHYNSEKHEKKPTLFFQNDKFFDQRVGMDDVKKKDSYGEYKIPNKAAYFAVLKNETLSFYSERNPDKILKEGAVDGLSILFIDWVSQRHPGSVGVKDLGEHSLGSCLEITTHVPKEFHPVFNKRSQALTQTIWIICMDEKKHKNGLMRELTKVKRSMQAIRKDPDDVSSDLVEEAKDKARRFKDLTPRQKQQLTLPTDGYWVLLQDWTQCTLRCGGGWSYQHFYCYPPKNGGKPCVGKAIRQKPCNLQPCPTIKTLLKKPYPEVRKPVVEARHVFKRPQRYSLCEVRENDAYLAEYDPKMKRDNKRPIRILMNTKAVSIYKPDSYKDLFYSFNLNTAQLAPSLQSTCCIVISDNYKRIKVCGYPENCNMGSNLNGPAYANTKMTYHNQANGWAKSWQQDFQQFKTICKHGKQAVLISSQDIKDLPHLDHIDGTTQMMKHKLEEEEQKDEIHRIHKTQEMGFRAIQKEFNLEQMIQQEEEEKGRQELELIRQNIAKEKKRLDCLHHNIEVKDVDFDFKNDDKELKQKFQLKILDQRRKMKLMLQRIRRKQKLKRNQLDQELKEVKAKISADLLTANHIGDCQTCIRARKDLDFRDHYCNTNFIESYISNKDCHSDEYWCEMCATHEFGDLYIKRRYQCIDTCEGVAIGSHKKQPPPEGGRWLWVQKYSATADPMKIQHAPIPK